MMQCILFLLVASSSDQKLVVPAEGASNGDLTQILTQNTQLRHTQLGQSLRKVPSAASQSRGAAKEEAKEEG